MYLAMTEEFQISNPIFLSVPDPEHSRFLVTTDFEL
jgi:hypothetical protein